METPKTITLAGYYDAEIPIDDGIYGAALDANLKLPIRIRRFNLDEQRQFNSGFAKIAKPESQRFIYRKSEGDEQQLRPDRRTFVVSDDEIQRRRLSELPTEQRAEYDRLVEEEETFLVQFCKTAITNHIWLQPGVTLTVDMGDEKIEVKTGEQIAEVFGGNLSMFSKLTHAIHQENTLSAQQKKMLRSLLDSTVSLPELKAPGATPAATVIDADKAATANVDVASAVPDPIPSTATK